MEFEFEIRDYLHHEGDKCKFEVYDHYRFVASFNPDPHENLTVCKNPGKLDQKLLHSIADILEKFN